MSTIDVRNEDSTWCQESTNFSVDKTCRTRLAVSGAAVTFESHRARLFAIALRMLRSHADVEDVLQDAYLRWHQAAGQDIQSPIGFLITVTTRICLDRLRELKQGREQAGGPLLSEPAFEDYAPSPEAQHELAEDVSLAFLAVLERLGPGERAAFLLREVFDYDYGEVAQMVGKSEATCRQMVHRARPRVREARARYVVSVESREHLLKKFLVAVESGDRKAVMALLVEDVERIAGGGGNRSDAPGALGKA